MIKNLNTAFVIKSNFVIDLNPGERLTVMGRKGQGSTAFLRTICGYVEIIGGKIWIKGRKALIA
jgi:ABC-type branched-subunit amino acid transport system ATPase component